MCDTESTTACDISTLSLFNIIVIMRSPGAKRQTVAIRRLGLDYHRHAHYPVALFRVCGAKKQSTCYL